MGQCRWNITTGSTVVYKCPQMNTDIVVRGIGNSDLSFKVLLTLMDM